MINIALFVLIAVIEMSMPYLTRKTNVFGISIPEAFVHHPKLGQWKKTYRLTIGGASLILLILQLAGNLFPIDLQILNLSFFIALMLMLLITTAVYLFFHHKVKSFKQDAGWEQQAHYVHVTDLALRQKLRLAPAPFFIIPIVITAALIAFTFMNYSQIADQIPIHWGINGEADRWVDKSPLSIILSPLILLSLQVFFLITSYQFKAAKLNLTAQNRQSSANRELLQRLYGSWYALVVNYAVTFLFVFLQFHSLLLQESSRTVSLLPIAVFLIAILLGLVVMIRKTSSIQEKFNHELTNESSVQDDQYWIWG
ncbi:DUF1648 domain-containing protein [Paenibacillus sp. NPDC058071]|uniref:DUF1648 domain-containing protein n=1 Tax=Paenibacillus sp. NPDC058071 TaxID=3346326 RepID=UPI0036D76879